MAAALYGVVAGAVQREVLEDPAHTVPVARLEGSQGVLQAGALAALVV